MSYVTGMPVGSFGFAGYTSNESSSSRSPLDDDPSSTSSDSSPSNHLPPHLLPSPFDVSDYFVDGAGQGVALHDTLKLGSQSWPLDAAAISAAPLFPTLDASADWPIKLDCLDASTFALPLAAANRSSHASSSASSVSSHSSKNGSHNGSTATRSGSSSGLPSRDASHKSSSPGFASAGVTPPGFQSVMMLPPSPFAANDPLSAASSTGFVTANISAHSRAGPTQPAVMSQHLESAATASTSPAYHYDPKPIQADQRRPSIDLTPPSQQPRMFGASMATQTRPVLLDRSSIDHLHASIPSVTYPHLNTTTSAHPHPGFYNQEAYSRPGPAPFDFANFNPNQRFRLVQPASATSNPVATNFAAVFPAHDTQPLKDENSGHNAVEKRYRNNINNNIAALADLVPALSHLRALPSAATSRRHSSQFIVSASSIGKIPTGLVDGVKAAQKLSKGSILSKSVDYIRHLRRTREEMAEDVEELKLMVRTLVDGGETIVNQWEERVKSKTPAREKLRYAEQAGGEEGEDDDEESGGACKPPASKKRKASDPKPSVGQVAGSQKRPATGVRGAAPLPTSVGQTISTHTAAPAATTGDLIQGLDFDPTQFSSFQNMPNMAGYGTTTATGHSPASNSSYGGTPPSTAQYAPQGAQRRQMLAAFMGLTFATGTGFEYRSRQRQKSARSNAPTSSHYPTPSTQADDHRPLLGPVQYGFNVVGLVSMVLLGILLFKPSLVLYHARLNDDVKAHKPPATARRQRSRAFERLAEVPHECDDAAMSNDCHEVFCKQDSLESAVVARQKLMQLAGGPQGSLEESISLAREATLAVYRKTKEALHLGDSDLLHGGDGSSIEATEEALTWVRIAEIETALGPSQTSAVSRLHTALRLYNLSRSADWPKGAASPAQTSFPRVNAVLSLHLRTLLGGTNSVSEMLWQQAMTRKEPGEEGSPEPWVGEALSANFDEACRILGREIEVDGLSAPSDTLPLLKIAEVRSEVALLELWSRIWVQTIRRTCPITDMVPSDITLGTLEDLPTRTEEVSDGLALQVAAARAVMEEAVNHIFSSTMPGSTIRTLACVTKGFWALGFGNPEVAYTSANVLARESTEGGPASQLACVAAFLELVFSKKRADVILGPGQTKTPRTTVDKVATATMCWLSVRRRHFVMQILTERAKSALSVTANAAGTGASGDHEDAVDDLRRATIRLKHLMSDTVFRSNDLIQVSTKQSREAIEAGEAKEYDLSDAVKDCLCNVDRVLERVNEQVLVSASTRRRLSSARDEVLAEDEEEEGESEDMSFSESEGELADLVEETGSV